MEATQFGSSGSRHLWCLLSLCLHPRPCKKPFSEALTLGTGWCLSADWTNSNIMNDLPRSCKVYVVFHPTVWACHKIAFPFCDRQGAFVDFQVLSPKSQDVANSPIHGLASQLCPNAFAFMMNGLACPIVLCSCITMCSYH